MSVDVTLLPAAIPPRLRDEDVTRVRRFKDREGDQGAFQYSVLASGALAIWLVTSSATVVDMVYGPSAWESVQGALYQLK
jgi:hypothetical protein